MSAASAAPVQLFYGLHKLTSDREAVLAFGLRLDATDADGDGVVVVGCGGGRRNPRRSYTFDCWRRFEERTSYALQAWMPTNNGNNNSRGYLACEEGGEQLSFSLCRFLFPFCPRYTPSEGYWVPPAAECRLTAAASVERVSSLSSGVVLFLHLVPTPGKTRRNEGMHHLQWAAALARAPLLLGEVEKPFFLASPLSLDCGVQTRPTTVIHRSV